MKKFLNLILFVLLLQCCTSVVNAIEFNVHKNTEKKANPYEEQEALARAMYAQNNIDETINLLYSIPLEARSSEDWVLIGNIKQDKGDYKSAVNMYQNAISTDKKNYKAYYNLGILYFEQEKYSLALKNFQNARKYKLDNPNIYYNLGCTYINLGEFKKAKNELSYAIELRNNVPEYYYNLAYAYKKIGNNKKAQYYMDIYDKLTENQ